METIESTIKNRGRYVSTTHGFSMYPLIRNEKEVTVIVPLLREPKKYDVVLYKFEDKYLLHRIIKVKGDKLIIRGDNCFNKEYMTKADIIGVLSEFFRGKHHIKCDSKSFYIYSALIVFFHPLQMTVKCFTLFIKRVLRFIKRIFGGKNGQI